MEVKKMERDHTFDNIRALLIYLVVLGHMLSGHTGKNMIAETIYYFIYFFHIPVFVIITGYFSKNLDKSRELALKNFFVPYLVFNIAFTLLGEISLFNQYESFRIFYPVYGMWFLLAVFIWKILAKDLVKIRFIVPLTILIGVLSGFSEEFNSFMTLARIVSFLPFFLIGYFIKPDHVKKMKEYPKWMSIQIIALYGILAYLIAKYNLINLETFYMRKPYSYAKQEDYISVIGRLFIYATGIIIGICLVNLFENKKKWYTKMGRNSLTVYIIHLVVVVNLKEIETPFDGSKWYVLYAIVAAAIITFILSRDFVMKGYQMFIQLLNTIIFKKFIK